MKKKILFLCQLNGAVNGAQIYNNLIYNFLKKKNYRINFLDTNLEKNPSNVGKLKLIKVFSYIFFYFNFLKCFLNYNLFYIVPGHTFLGIWRFYFIIKILKIFKKKIIIHHHGYGIYYIIKKNSYLKKIFIGKKIINIILTNDLKEKFYKIDKKLNTIIIKNFSTFKFSKKKKINKKLRILFFSNFMKEKGFENFVKLAKLFPKFQFIICGGENQWSKNILRKNFSPNINNLGFLSYKKKDVYWNSDIFIFPTYYKTEGVPISLLDAMASSCAIITTFHNGIPETIGKSALYVKKKNFNDLKKKLKYLTVNNNTLKKFQKKSLKTFLLSKNSKINYLNTIENLFRNY